MKRLWIAAAALLALASAASAEEIEKGLFSFGVRGVYSWTTGADTRSNGKGFPGVQLRMHGSMLGLELSSDYRRIDLPSETEINMFPIHGDLLVYLLPGRISPYLVGGANWILFDRISGPSTSANVSPRLGVEAGGGVEVMYDESWSFDIGCRRLWLTDANKAGSIPSNGYYAMAGLNYHFGY
jgi:hypothetical protein